MKSFINYKKSFIHHLGCFLFLACLFFIHSCTNLTDDFSSTNSYESSASKRTCTFTGTVSLNGALPSEIAQSIQRAENDSDSARTAIPQVDSTKIEQCVKVSQNKSIIKNDTFTGNVFELPLAEGNYDITVGIRDKENEDYVYFSDSFPVTVTSENPVLNHTFYPAPTFDGNGSIELKLSVPDSVTKVKAYFNEETYELTNEDMDVTLFYFTIDSIKSGSYDVSFFFYSGSDSSLYPVYSTNQTVNVFDNMKTDSWLSDGSFSTDSDGNFVLSSAMISSYSRTTFYVGNTSAGSASDDTGEGSPYKPYATFSKIQQIIRNAGTSSTDYRIFVSGTVACNEKFENDDIYGKAKSITIQREEHAEDAILDGNNEGSVLKIKTSVPFTIRGVTITNGNAKTDDSGNGGGIRIWASSNVTIDGGTLITGNKAENYGGGISVEGTAKLILKDCTISGNTAAKGGAIYSKNDFSINGTTWVPCGSDKKNLVYLDNGAAVNINGPIQPLFGARETFTFDNLKRGTTVIKTSGSSIKAYENFFSFVSPGWEKIISDDGKSISIDSPIYISATGGTSSDGADGTYAKPFDSFASLISSEILNDESTSYLIRIDGEVKGNQIIQNTGVKAASLTIEGANGLSNGEPQDSLNGNGIGTVLSINNSVPVTIKNLKITGGNNTEESGCGGGIYLSSNAKVTLGAGCLVSGNKAKQGGGIYNAGTLILDGATVGDASKTTYASRSAYSNYAVKGGGIFFANTGKVTVKEGSVVAYNFGYQGGGIACANNSYSSASELTVSDGEIKYNGCDPYPLDSSKEYGWNSYGGGIFADGAKFTFTGGSIHDNFGCDGGGGIFLQNTSNATMSGGSIYNNSYHASSGKEGSEVLLFDDCTFSMTAGSIYADSQKDYGVKLRTNKTFLKISGEASISAKTPVLLTEGTYLTIAGELSAAAPLAAIAMSDWKRGNIFAKADGTIVNDLSDYKDKFEFTQEGWDIYVSDDKKSITTNQPIYVKAGGHHEATTKGTLADPYDTIENAVKGLLNNENTNYTMVIDGILTGAQIIPEDLKADSSATYKAKSLLIKGKNGNYENDCLNGGFSESSKGTTLTVKTQVPVTIEAIQITGGYAETNGGGINNSGNLTIKNLFINSNTASEIGGGIYNTGTITITGGQISYNTSVKASGYYGGGGFANYGTNAEAYLDGVKINKNRALTDGGGIYNYLGKVFVYGDTVIGGETSDDTNEASGRGGGIYNEGQLYLGYNTTSNRKTWNGSIKYNSGGNGGGLYILSAHSAYMASGSIESNSTEDGSGGNGVYVGGSFIIGWDAYIPEGSSSNKQNVYLDSGKTIRLAGYLSKHTDSKQMLLTLPSYSDNITVLKLSGSNTSIGLNNKKFKTLESNWKINSEGQLCYSVSDASQLKDAINSGHKDITIDRNITITEGISGSSTEHIKINGDNSYRLTISSSSSNLKFEYVDFFIGKTTSNAAGGMLNLTGNGSNTLEISNCTFTDCSTPNRNIDSNLGGSIYASNFNEITISNCKFYANNGNGYNQNKELATSGGFIYIGSGSYTITNCSFEGGYASHGGAIAIHGGSGTISGSSFNNNYADWNGGAIDFSSGTSLTISNCTFSGNNARGEYQSGNIWKASGTGTLTISGGSGISTGTFTGERKL